MQAVQQVAEVRHLEISDLDELLNGREELRKCWVSATPKDKDVDEPFGGSNTIHSETNTFCCMTFADKVRLMKVKQLIANIYAHY